MAKTHSIPARPGSDHAPLRSLSDADLALRSPLATAARALTLVPAPTVVELRPDPDRLALQLLTEFRAAWARGDESRMTEVILDATELDDAHRGGPRLMDEIRGIQTPAVA
ncbi:hypothetical protein GCM10010331_49450 [Streptomyces xanthochromogenes]|uniref:hypothetical protein n=1 Tax=Streptomyces xanthochromogenes TaxID=67384 RepID=UPI001674039A|nr:hypothetical protein [Streptomyces xanthochromogenes]GHB55705.1 hypothetical protein GCM10010331_49450 [Streptomyces xanthochromogenes]